MKRKLLCCFIAFAIMMLCCPCHAFASDTPCYSVDNKTVEVGDIFEISVAIENNSGIISNRLKVLFDSEYVSLVEVRNTNLLNGYTSPAPTIASPYTLRWADSLASVNNTSNGVIAVLKFEALKQTSQTSVTIEHNEARNVNGNKITFSNAISTIVINPEAEKAPQYSVSENKAVAKGDEFVLRVQLLNNPGITSDRFKVYYDSSFVKLKSYTNCGLLNGFTTPSPTISSPYTFRWADSLAETNNTKDGVLIELTFEALNETNSTSIIIEHIEARNYVGSKISFVNAVCSVSIGVSSQSDPSVLIAAIENAYNYTKSEYTAESVAELYAVADSYVNLSKSVAAQWKYDEATETIISAIQALDALSNYEITSFDGTTAILINVEGKNTSIIFSEHINGFCTALDVVADGIVNAKDFAYLLKSFKTDDNEYSICITGLNA